MTIYTRTGDKGQTSLLSGARVPKHSPRVETYGTLDELNSWIGYVRAVNENAEVEGRLARLQPYLHVLCSDIASPWAAAGRSEPGPRIREGSEIWLEEDIDQMTADMPELEHFILPGGGQAGAALHVARTVCRRAERRMIELNDAEGQVNPHAMRFVNRLSDYLFTLARWANWQENKEETQWVGRDHMQP